MTPTMVGGGDGILRVISRRKWSRPGHGLVISNAKTEERRTWMWEQEVRKEEL